MKSIVLEDQKYKLYENHRDGFDLEALTERFTEYFLPFDYVLGDWAYGKVRLKGFYKPENEKCIEMNNINNHQDYLKNNCAHGCRYFIIEKVIE